MTPRFLMCPMSTNILTVLANFHGLIIQFSQKTSVMTVATLARYRSIALTLAHTSCITTVCCTLHKTHLLSLTTHYRKGYSPTCTPQSHLSSSVIYILIIFIDISTASVSY